MSNQKRVTFFIPNSAQVELLKNADPDRDFHLYSTGVHVWVGQTYARLKRAGYPVVLTDKVPTSGILVIHADHIGEVLRRRSLFSNLTLVVARADRPAQIHADYEIVQNAFSAQNSNTFHVQHWPQPGLVKRDVARDSKVENIAFKGVIGEMAPAFASAEWEESLRSEGMEWRTDAVACGGNDANYQVNWNDYSDVDVVVALRKDTSHTHTKKPASKLINAWLAGVPAILGPEQAYRELRQNELDYIEASSPEEAHAAIVRLKNDPVLYKAMVQRAQERARQVTAENCVESWAHLLFTVIPQRKGSTLVSLVKLFAKSMRSHLSAAMAR